MMRLDTISFGPDQRVREQVAEERVQKHQQDDYPEQDDRDQLRYPVDKPSERGLGLRARLELTGANLLVDSFGEIPIRLRR